LELKYYELKAFIAASGIFFDPIAKLQRSVVNVFVKGDGKEIQFSAPSSDQTLQLNGTIDFPGFDKAACFGQLPFIRGILESNYLKDDYNLEVDYITTKTGKEFIRSFDITSKRTKINYRFSDPTLPNIIKPRILNDLVWLYSFNSDKQLLAEFNEAKKLNGLSGLKEPVFEIVFNGEDVEFQFGTGGSNTIDLKPTITDLEINDGSPCGVKIDTDNFMTGLGFAAEGGRISISHKALKFEFVKNDMFFELVIYAKKD